MFYDHFRFFLAFNFMFYSLNCSHGSRASEERNENGRKENGKEEIKTKLAGNIMEFFFQL